MRIGMWRDRLGIVDGGRRGAWWMVGQRSGRRMMKRGWWAMACNGWAGVIFGLVIGGL